MQTRSELTIELKDAGKKFGSEWVFKHLNFHISRGDKVVILGGNGSGKSTLLQIISGYVLPNQGQVSFTDRTQAIEPSEQMRFVSLSSPYLELVDEYKLTELIEHCAAFKPFIKQLTVQQVVEIMELEHAKHKMIKTYSSGMRQRVKLGLAILADCPVLLLDEPVSNLDRKAVDWYKTLIAAYATDKTVIVCSNSIADEYAFCTRQLDLADFKQITKPVTDKKH